MKNKQTWSFIKDVLLIYLAASKILSWIQSISEMAQSDFSGEIGFGILILARVLSADLPNILVAICFVYVDRRKGNPFVKFALLYVLALILMLAYNGTLNWFFGGYLTLEVYFAIAIGFSINFLIVTSLLLLKRYFKNRFKDTPDAPADGLKETA